MIFSTILPVHFAKAVQAVKMASSRNERVKIYFRNRNYRLL